MSTASIVTVRRRDRFQSTGLMQRNAPASGLALQALVQAIVQLNQKVDSLAQTHSLPTLFQQPQEFAPTSLSQLSAAVHPQEQITPPANPPQRQARVNRSKLLDFFD
ncbi:MAG: hypothetical protein IH624_13940 [Phycisphaerae bacterium]|nr:hypothetical protein [Phycisphaerae bacterium]